MNETNPASNIPSPSEPEDATSLVFAQMVLQHSSLASIFLGKTPNPQTGQLTPDLDNARFLIDQLEMLAVKTRGNLAAHENSLLKQTLTGLRLAFVEAVSKPQPPPSAAAESPAAAAQTPKPGEAAATPGPPSASEPPASSEPQKKFTKKY